MPSQIFLRVDASVEIGFGHLSRCLTLARALRLGGAHCTFLSTSKEAAVRRWIGDEGHQLVPLSAAAGSEDDAEETLETMRGADRLVIDGYVFADKYVSLVKAAGIPICLIDDAVKARYDCDVVVNQNLYAASGSLIPSHSTRLLMGPSYALVRQEFATARLTRGAARPEANRILVTLGGSDPRNDTPAVLEALQSIPTSRLCLRVVIGPGSRNSAQIIETSTRSSIHEVEAIQGARDLAEHMAWADVAVTAGGTTLLELCCVGLPCLVLTVARNQEPVVESAVEQGVTTAVGDLSGWERPQLLESIRGLLRSAGRRNEMISRQRRLVDGEGPRRVATELAALRTR